MASRIARMSLLWKILLSTSIALTALFAATGWIVQDYAVRTTSQSLEDEVRASFQSYDSLWRSRAKLLASISQVLSRMSDVRAAFGTRDEATIRDTARELWDKISREDAIFLVTDPRGEVIASLGGGSAGLGAARDLEVVRAAARHFPKQTSGFALEGGLLYQIVVTPVYVEAAHGPGLLNVLVAGYVVDAAVARGLKAATGGSDFVFAAGHRVMASTLASAPSAPAKPGIQRVAWRNAEYLQLSTPLLDIQGNPVAELRIFRSFEGAERRIAALRRNIAGIWALALLLGLCLTFVLARRIVEPVQALDRGAAEVARGNYDYRVPVKSQDELGRLAQAFNAMCGSIQDARNELIRRERITTIGRLSTSIVHDLRNPLAAIYGGAEMLVDSGLSAPQIQRLAGNIYRSSRRVQQLLQELVDVGRGKSASPEWCRLRDIVAAACDAHAGQADLQAISVESNVPEEIELPLDRARMERVFSNLIGNALEAMPDGGALRISAERSDHAVTITVEDTGPGISEQIRSKLFHPFASAGKKTGLGLGLALSQQAVLDHGGDLWADTAWRGGARFFVRLPL